MIEVGFVGLGGQGGPMARRIGAAGYPMTLWARRREALEAFAAPGVRFASDLGELGSRCRVLCVCVTDDAGVDAVLRGSGGALAGMAAGSTVVIHSTVHPDTCRRLQSDFPDLSFVDAPVSGGGGRAAAGTLLVMVGGSDEAVDRCRPIFECYGDPVLHVGGLGSGEVAKVLNNAIFTAQVGLAARVLALAGDHGIDAVTMSAVLTAGSGRSYAAEVAANSTDLLAFGAAAGALLAKDVGILVDLMEAPGESELIGASLAALRSMGVTEPLR